jgi:hypothetical protein
MISRRARTAIKIIITIIKSKIKIKTKAATISKTSISQTLIVLIKSLSDQDLLILPKILKSYKKKLKDYKDLQLPKKIRIKTNMLIILLVKSITALTQQKTIKAPKDLI